MGDNYCNDGRDDSHGDRYYDHYSEGNVDHEEALVVAAMGNIMLMNVFSWRMRMRRMKR